MFDSLIYAMGPWFPGSLWTLNGIQCRHLQNHVRRGGVEWRAHWAQSGPGPSPLCCSAPVPGLPFWSPHQWRFGTGRKELGHLLDSPEFLATYELSDFRQMICERLCYVPPGIVVRIRRGHVKSWHLIIVLLLPFLFIICSNEGLSDLISKNPFRFNFLRISRQHRWDPAFFGIFWSSCRILIQRDDVLLGLHFT